MIGQEYLIKHLDSFTIGTFPHTSLFIGPEGCGKHTLVNNISSRLGVQLIDVTELLGSETFEDMLHDPVVKMYLINVSNLNIKEQGLVCTILEDTSITSFISLIASNPAWLSSSIIDNCTVFRFNAYTNEELGNFIPVGIEDQDLAFHVAPTPGTIKNINNSVLIILKNICTNIIYNINNINFTNLLEVADNIDYCGEYPDKPSANEFLNCMDYMYLTQATKQAEDNIIVDTFYSSITKYYLGMISNNKVDKKTLIERYIIDIWNHAARKS